MKQIVDPNQLFNALNHLGLESNDTTSQLGEEKEALEKIYNEVVKVYFNVLFPSPTPQNFIGKKRDEHGRILVEIICRSCGKQIKVYNRRTVFCLAPAPCKNNFNTDKRSVFEFIKRHSLDLARRIKVKGGQEKLEALLQDGYHKYKQCCG